MSYEFYAPSSVEETLEILDSKPRPLKILAGGTDLMLDLRSKKTKLAGIVDISKLVKLQEIAITGDQVSIGSLVTFSQLASSSLIQERVAFLAEAASLVGSPQIRNQATIGGNIANASPAADSVVPLIALDATAIVVSQDETREVPLTQLLCGVGKNNLAPNELLTEICFNLPSNNARSTFVKFGRRNALAIARISIALLIEKDAEFIKDARVALGAVAPNPFRALELEDLLCSNYNERTDKEAIIAYATQVVSKQLGNRPSARWKNEAIRGLLREALHKIELAGREG